MYFATKLGLAHSPIFTFLSKTACKLDPTVPIKFHLKSMEELPVMSMGLGSGPNAPVKELKRMLSFKQSWTFHLLKYFVESEPKRFCLVIIHNVLVSSLFPGNT